MITLFQSQENIPRAIECGQEALKVFEKIGGPSSNTTITNISNAKKKKKEKEKEKRKGRVGATKNNFLDIA